MTQQKLAVGNYGSRNKIIQYLFEVLSRLLVETSDFPSLTAFSLCSSISRDSKHLIRSSSRVALWKRLFVKHASFALGNSSFLFFQQESLFRSLGGRMYFHIKNRLNLLIPVRFCDHLFTGVLFNSIAVVKRNAKSSPAFDCWAQPTRGFSSFTSCSEDDVVWRRAQLEVFELDRVLIRWPR